MDSKETGASCHQPPVSLAVIHITPLEGFLSKFNQHYARSATAKNIPLRCVKFLKSQRFEPYPELLTLPIRVRIGRYFFRIDFEN
jgi:hypothetical protein